MWLPRSYISPLSAFLGSHLSEARFTGRFEGTLCQSSSIRSKYLRSWQGTCINLDNPSSLAGMAAGYLPRMMYLA